MQQRALTKCTQIKQVNKIAKGKRRKRGKKKTQLKITQHTNK